MESHNRNIIILGVVALGLIWIGALIMRDNSPSSNPPKTNSVTNDQKIEAELKKFYDWYGSEKKGVLDDSKTIVENAKIKGFITPEFATTTIEHPLVTTKKADIFLCASKKSEKAFPNSFVPFPATSSTRMIRVDGISSIPNHIITLWIKDNKISAISCPMIPTIE